MFYIRISLPALPVNTKAGPENRAGFSVYNILKDSPSSITLDVQYIQGDERGLGRRARMYKAESGSGGHPEVF